MNSDHHETDETIQDDAVIATALKVSFIGLIVVAAAAGGIYLWLTRPDEPVEEKKTTLTAPKPRAMPDLVVPQMPFRDITRSAGIDFSHENGAYQKSDGTAEKLLPETMCGGCAFLDFDDDGDQDILLTNGKRWDWDERGESRTSPALYANDGTGSFKNVTSGSGLDIPMYGNGVAVGDYDNDGRVDLYFSNLGNNRLFHNEGDGKFSDVTDASGTAGNADRWSTSSGWFDYDNDGDLDLFVCNYVAWSREFDLAQNFNILGTTRAYGRPQDFPGQFPNLYRNDGGGKFTDVSSDAGVQIVNSGSGKPMSKSLGLSFADFDNNGFLDVLVANDTIQNQLFMNQGNGTFLEQGDVTGVAFDINGNARGAMGTDTGYPRNSDAAVVAIGNFANEMTAFYVAQVPNEPIFNDEAVSNGIGPVTRVELTFGLFFFDCDLNGRLDLFAANGHLEEEINRVQSSQHYEQPPQLLWNCGADYETEFCVVEEENCGAEFTKRMVGRGAAYADIDGDGDLDVLVASTGRPPRLMRNEQKTGHHYLRLKLQGTQSNRDAIGTVVRLNDAAGRMQRRTVLPTRSYQSQVELPVTFGIGSQTASQEVTVTWPDGTEQTATCQPDQTTVIVQGE